MECGLVAVIQLYVAKLNFTYITVCTKIAKVRPVEELLKWNAPLEIISTYCAVLINDVIS